MIEIFKKLEERIAQHDQKPNLQVHGVCDSQTASFLKGFSRPAITVTSPGVTYILSMTIVGSKTLDMKYVNYFDSFKNFTARSKSQSSMYAAQPTPYCPMNPSSRVSVREIPGAVLTLHDNNNS